MTDRLLKTALTLAAKGIAVFPIAPHGKVPMTPHGCRNATRDTATIRQWWTRDPIFNIGAACGAVSGIWVLDVDTGERDGEAHLNALEQQHGQLPNTVSCITGGGGRHLYFRWPKDRDIRNSVNRVAMGVDVRAGGGYVVVPPSTHPSGRFYVWAPDCADRFAEAPDWLLDLATRVVRFPDNPVAAPQSWADLFHEGVTEGGRNDAVARVTGYLLNRGLETAELLEIVAAFNDARCKPPLSNSELLRTVDSIIRRDLKSRGVE